MKFFILLFITVFIISCSTQQINTGVTRVDDTTQETPVDVEIEPSIEEIDKTPNEPSYTSIESTEIDTTEEELSEEDHKTEFIKRVGNDNLIFNNPDYQNSTNSSIQIYTTIDHLAVMLPFSQRGAIRNASLAIKNGIIFKYYTQNIERNKSSIKKITFHDSAKGVISAYEEAVDAGADLIIGPLLKTELQELTDNKELDIPVLAANNIDNLLTTREDTINNFYQFSLSPEQEAIAIAEAMYLGGYLNTLIISLNNDWGQRTTNAFIEHYLSLGAQVVDIEEIPPNIDNKELRATISRLVKVEERQVQAHKQNQNNERRERQFAIENDLIYPLPDEQLTEQELIEKELLIDYISRRQDVDSILFIVDSINARKIRPFLSYYLANDLTIYGISQLYTGENNPIRDKDLNNIIFVDAPWVATTNTPEHKLVESLWNDSRTYKRLYAMGMDLLALIPIIYSEPISRVFYSGTTGTLSVEKDMPVVWREPLTLQFIRGVPQRLNSIARKPITNN